MFQFPEAQCDIFKCLVPSNKIKLNKQKYKKQQISTMKKQKPGDVWYFCLKNDFKNLSFIKKSKIFKKKHGSGDIDWS